jgi:hypothetical protein
MSLLFFIVLLTISEKNICSPRIAIIPVVRFFIKVRKWDWEYPGAGIR